MRTLILVVAISFAATTVTLAASKGSKGEPSKADKETVIQILKDNKILKRCQICFQSYVTGNGDPAQCGPGATHNNPFVACGPWSDDPNAGEWTKQFIDESDNRAGGCEYFWRLNCENWQ